MQVLKNPLLTLRQKAYRVFSYVANWLTVGRWQAFVAESRAHAQARRLKGEIYMLLAGYRDIKNELSLPMSVRELGLYVRCQDQIDLELALHELIDEEKIYCFHIDVATFKRLQCQENELLILTGAGYGRLSGSPYLGSAEFRTKRIYSLIHLSPVNDFWDLTVIHPSPFCVF